MSSEGSGPQPGEGRVRPGAADEGLIRLGGRPSMRAYLAETWRRRDYVWHVPLNEVRSQHRNAILGSSWLLLTPLLQVGVYYVAFSLIVRADRGIDNYLAFLTVGVFTFHLTQRCAGHGARSIVSNIGLIRAIQFPRILLPLSTVMGQALSYIPVVLVMLVITVLGGGEVDPKWLFVPEIVFAQLLFSLGVALIAARLNYAVRDLENTLPFMFRLLFYLSGVIYSVQRLVGDELLRNLFALNPMYSYVTVTRWAVLDIDLPPYTLTSALVWAALAPVLGLVVFRHAEGQYGRAS